MRLRHGLCALLALVTSPCNAATRRRRRKGAAQTAPTTGAWNEELGIPCQSHTIPVYWYTQLFIPGAGCWGGGEGGRDLGGINGRGSRSSAVDPAQIPAPLPSPPTSGTWNEELGIPIYWYGMGLAWYTQLFIPGAGCWCGLRRAFTSATACRGIAGRGHQGQEGTQSVAEAHD